MSHVDIRKTQARSLQVIKAMCKAKQWTFHQNQTTYKWFGKHVGDYPLPKGKAIADLGKCNHAISIPECTYEIGVCKEKDGTYTFLYDVWDKRLAAAVGGKSGNIIAQSYAIAETQLAAAAAGLRVTNIVHAENGAVELDFAR